MGLPAFSCGSPFLLFLPLPQNRLLCCSSSRLLLGCLWITTRSPFPTKSHRTPRGENLFPFCLLTRLEGSRCLCGLLLAKAKDAYRMQNWRHENFRVTSPSCKLQGLTNALNPTGAKETRLGTFSSVATEREFLCHNASCPKIAAKTAEKLISNKA